MDKKIVRASYESCLNASARLLAYSTSRPISITEVHERQDILAEEDLIAFCIHARRLIENADLIDLAKEVQIDTNDNREPQSIWQILGYLIHHDTLLIIRCATRFRMLMRNLEGLTGEEYLKSTKDDWRKTPYSEPVAPTIFFKSDRTKGFRMFALGKFLEIFSRSILETALTNNKWLQDDVFKDTDLTEEEARIILSKIS